MARSLDGGAGSAWRLLEAALDGPLHPGGTDATETLLDRAGVDSTTRLLDIGCGAGGALRLARERDADAVGLDPHPSNPGAVRGEMSSLPFGNGRFDVVLGECVLCLSSDLGGTLAEISRVLAPSGRLALSDVTVDGTPPELPTPIDGLLCLDDAREPDRLRGELAAEGFEVSDVRTHRDDLLAMRDRLAESLNYDRVVDALGEGAKELEAAVESGRISYMSLIATPYPGDGYRGE